MRAVIAFVSMIACSSVTTAYAQQELVGTYKGEYWERGDYVHPHVQTVILRISSTEGGKVAGKLELGESSCRGVYDVQGTYQGAQMSLRTSEGPMAGCAQQITLTSKDRKLVGNMSGEASGRPGIELVRQ